MKIILAQPNEGEFVVQTLVGFLLRPFEGHASIARRNLAIEGSRIALGLLIIHQALDVLGIAFVLEHEAAAFVRLHAIALAAGACLTIGLATPLAIVCLLWRFALASTGSLGDMVTAIVLWGMLWMGAGQTASLDAFAAPIAPWYRRAMYALAIDRRSDRGMAYVRFSLTTLFWGVCFVAMAYHAFDDLWLSGEVLPVALTGPYFSAHHETFSWLQQASPAWFHRVLWVGLAVQAAWETLLLPLMYFRLGRWFVLVQGIAFFVFSAVCLNLQYLPFVELVFWGLLFGVGWRPAAQQRQSQERVHLAAPAFSCLAACVTALHLVMAPYNVQVIKSPRYLKLEPCFRLFAQRPVCVFNRGDMNVNTCWFVLHEIDADGRHKRTVPYLDAEGARLSLLRNDFLYFVLSLRWQRTASFLGFDGNDASAPTENTRSVARKLALVDARLTGGAKRPRYYRAEVMRRDLDESLRPPQWTAPRLAGGWTFQIGSNDLVQSGWPAYDLPPGCWFERRRRRETDQWLAALPAHGETSIASRPKQLE